MSEHDYVLANADGATFRADLNSALLAVVSNNSKATAPSTTFAYMWWADTGNDLLKQRNAADSAWVSILTLSTGEPAVSPASLTQALSANSFAINTSRATVASHATTSAIWAALGNEIDFTGAETITNLPAAPIAGAMRILHHAGAVVWTDNANISVQGDANFTAEADDIAIVHALTTTTFRVSFLKKDGTAVVAAAGGGGEQFYASSSYDISTASGNVDFTGAGFNPTAAYIIAGDTSNLDLNVCVGFGTGSGDASIGNASGTTAGHWWHTADAFFVLATTSNYVKGALSMITDGVRLTMTKTGTPGGIVTISVLMIK
jgi:hypothetical protein